MEVRVTTEARSQMVDLTAEVSEACRRWGGTGLVHVFCPHTTAGILVNEAFDSDVAADALAWMARAVPRSGPYAHAEGNSDAHIRSVLAGCGTMLPVRAGKLALGRWQGVFLLESDGPRTRSVMLTFVEGSGGPAR